MLSFWRINLNPHPGVLTYLGRFIHWSCIAYAVFVVVISTVSIASSLMTYFGRSGWQWEPVFAAIPPLAFTVVLAFVVCLIGRAVRFVLSRE